MSLFRPTALRYIRNLGCAAGLILGLFSLWSASAMASPQGSGEPAACPGQTFSQPFEAFGDSNYYTLVEGSEFNGGAEGWQFKNGADVVAGSRPDGSSATVLDLPSGAIAISPVVCVTLQYPTARTWVESVEGNGGVTVGVYYSGAKPAAHAVGRLNAKDDDGWTLSKPFNIKPQLTGNEEGVREVRFIYVNTTRSSDLHIWGLYVDPRMR